MKKSHGITLVEVLGSAIVLALTFSLSTRLIIDMQSRVTLSRLQIDSFNQTQQLRTDLTNYSKGLAYRNTCDAATGVLSPILGENTSTYLFGIYSLEDVSALRPDLFSILRESAVQVYPRTLQVVHNTQNGTLRLQFWAPPDPENFTPLVDPSLDPSNLRYERTYAGVTSVNFVCTSSSFTFQGVLKSSDGSRNTERQVNVETLY